MFTQRTEIVLALMFLGTLAACTSVTLSDSRYASLSVDPHLTEKPVLLVTERRCQHMKM